MKRSLNLISIAGFFTIIIMLAVSTLIFGRDSFSEIFSSKGDIRVKTETFINSTFPLDGNWRSLHTMIYGAVTGETINDIFSDEDRLIRVYPRYDKDRAFSNVGLINNFARTTDIPISLVLAPTAAGVYHDSLPDYIENTDQLEIINSLYYKLGKGVGSIDMFYPLYSVKDDYIFYRTSDCWTSLGAYYAYEEMMRQLGAQPFDLSNYDLEYADDSYYGELYHELRYMSCDEDSINLFRPKLDSTVSEVKLYRDNEEIIARSVYFKSAFAGTNKNDVYLHGDDYTRAEIDTTSESGLRLLLIKGHYANTLVSFLLPHYEHITIVDPDRLKAEGKTLSDVAEPDSYNRILIMYDCVQFSRTDSFDIFNDK
ncbi:MAG: hypothetical protein IJ571_01575 [Ruminococcus sp.]|nr:hypothetical protein [Ruminococcus sp.]